MSALSENSRHILFWLEEGREPTEHILNEIMESKDAFEKIQGQLLFILRSQDSLKNTTLIKFPRFRKRQGNDCTEDVCGFG